MALKNKQVTKKNEIEKKEENKIKNYLKKIDAYYHKNQGNIFTKLGIPDIECCYKGKFIALEVKRKQGGIVSMAQLKNGLNIAKSNGIFAIVDDVSQVMEIVEDINNNKTEIRHNLTVEKLENLLNQRYDKLLEKE